MATHQNLNYTLSGKITSLKGEPVKDLTVRAYDKDPVSPDGLLGSAVTDEAGLYIIQFTTNDFQVGGPEPSGPDVYIKVFSGEDFLGVSKVKNNSPEKITIDLKVDNSKIKPNPNGDRLDAGMIKRLDILNSVTTDVKIKEAISDAFKVSQGDWGVAKEAIKKTGADEALLNKLDFVNSLAEVTNDKPDLVNVLVDLPGISNLRDLALTHSTQSLAEILEKSPLAKDDFADNPKTGAILSANSIMRNVFPVETSAVLQRMAKAGELPIDKKLGDEVASFLSNQPEFNIRTTSIYNALKHPEAFNGIEETDKERVTNNLKSLQRVQAISPAAEAVAALINSNIHSAHEVAEMPEEQFVSVLSVNVGAADAKKIYCQATNSKVRNEQMLMNFSESVKGTGIAAIDGAISVDAQVRDLPQYHDFKPCLDILYRLFHDKQILINCENIFIYP